ncbi:MAG: PEP-CTERM sorting domain-containing protein [Opitutales bacterium]
MTIKIPTILSLGAVICALPAFGQVPFSETFDTVTSIDDWTVAGDAFNETSLNWLDGGGNPGGALEFGGFHTGEGAGRGYSVFHTEEGIDFTGLTTLSFDARLTAPSVGTNIQMQIGIPGVAPTWHSLTNSGLSNDWNTFLYDVSSATPGEGTFRIDFLVAAGAFEGAGATFAADNITLTAVPEPSTYAALFGALALGFAFLRRRRAA